MADDGLSPELVRQIMDQAAHTDAVRQALQRKAERVLARARLTAMKAGMPKFAEGLHVETGVRPGAKSPKGIAREYAEVGGTTVDGEYGSISPMQALSRSRNA